MKFYDMIMAINLSFASWVVTDKTIKAIQHFLGDEGSDIGENVPGDMLVEEMSTHKHIELPVEHFFNIQTPRELWKFEPRGESLKR